MVFIQGAKEERFGVMIEAFYYAVTTEIKRY